MEKLQIPKLKGKSNWTVWKLQVESSLQFHDFEGVLIGQIIEPVELAIDANDQEKKEYEVAKKLYKKANGFAINLLTTSMEDEPQQLVLMYRTAREMWTKLLSSYEQKSEQRLEHLYLQLFEYTKDTADTIATHVSKLQKLWMELNEESMRVDNCKLPLTLLITRILSTLPHDYFEFRTTWESVPRDQRTVEYLLERLSMVEMRVNKAADVNSAAALVAKGEHVVKQKATGSIGDNKASADVKKDYYRVKCYECGELGHIKRRCPNRNMSDAYLRKAEALFGVALVADEMSDTAVWIADTGASHHMTKSKEFFTSYTPFDEPKRVMVGNQRTMLAYGYGDIQVKALVQGMWYDHYMKDVWYTPEVVKNLFSVPAAADKGLVYRLDKDRCELVKNGNVIVTGERNCSLYKLLIKPIRPDDPAVVCVAHKVEMLQVWHERLGHQNRKYVEKFLKARGIKYITDNYFCEGCAMGKLHRLSFGSRLDSTDKPGDRVHADVCGPMEMSSFSGCRFYVLFKDDYSKYRYIYFLRQKSEVCCRLKQFLAEAKTMGHVVKELLTDGGGEFNNRDVKTVVHEYGINHRITMPYTPEQNGAAERENRTVMEAVRSMLHSSNLPNKLWAEAANTAVYTLNRTAPTKIEGKTPYELWHSKEAPIDHLKIFGTECFVHVPKQKRQKLDDKAMKGRVVGYCDNKDGFRIYVPEKGTVVLSRDVLFKEERIASTVEAEPETIETVDAVNDIIMNSDMEAGEENDAENEENEMPVIRDRREVPDAANEKKEMSVTRDRRELKMPRRFDDYVMIAEYNDEPNSYAQAMNSEYSHQWEKAMNDEMRSLADNGTWELVSRPENRKIIDNRWVYKVKLNENGSVDKFKARLVARGFTQEAGVDFSETYSPVARFDTIRSVLSVAASENLHLVQFDVKTAFLYGELDETIYMEQPAGYTDGTDRVCKLKKSLYGLKQAPRCWNRKFKSFLDRYGLQCSSADSCLFFNSAKGHKLLLALYVDDGLVAAQDVNDLELFLSELRNQFSITVASASCFIGLIIKQDDDGSVFINQAHYVRRLLEKFNLADCNAVATPLDKAHMYDDDREDAMLSDSVPYREAVGSLLYLATGTRPDISFAVSVVSQVLDKPTKRHWEMVKRILRYLKGTAELGIVYRNGLDPGVLTAYSDADYAGDTKTRRSTSGFCCKYMGGPVSWSSRRQKSVALSTTEAEYIAASEAAKDVVWLTRLFNEISTLTAVPVLLIDNMSAVKLVQNPVFHRKSKHIDVRYHFVREKHEEGRLMVSHICGEDQLADVLTKPLAKDRFQRLCREILNID